MHHARSSVAERSLESVTLRGGVELAFDHDDEKHLVGDGVYEAAAFSWDLASRTVYGDGRSALSFHPRTTKLFLMVGPTFGQTFRFSRSDATAYVGVSIGLA